MECRVSWPGWEVGRCIGKGGFGSVYEIQREVFGDIERCALKIITIPKDNDEIEYMKCEGMDDESITSTLHSKVGDIINEYKLMTRMRENPNIVHCDDFRYARHEDDLGWDIFIKMELLTPLMKVMDQMRDEKEIVRLGIELCNALIACQKHNIIHRDIKPQNIFISQEGYYKLGDFGIARTMEHTTRATAGIGTYSFMAPEVALGKSYGPTVDIYSLGLVLYWLLNERRGPFVPLPPAVPNYADNDKARMRRYSGEQIPAPKYGSEVLKAIVMKACEFDPKDRYQTAKEMMEELEKIANTKKQESQDFIQMSEGEVHEEEQTVVEIGNTAYTQRTVIQKENNSEAQEQKTVDKQAGGRPVVRIVAVAALLAVVVLMGFFAARSGNKTSSPEMNVPDTSVSVQETTAVQAETVASQTDAWKDNVLMADNIDKEAFNMHFSGKLVSLEELIDWYSKQFVFGSTIQRAEISNVIFLDTLASAPDSSWDVSVDKSRSVLAWVEENGTYFDLYIAGENGINGAEACSELFQGYTNVTNIDFNGCFYTEYTATMKDMFSCCTALKKLDISHFNTSNVTNMSGVFYCCSKLESIDVSCFETSKVVTMGGLFGGCEKLEALDLSTFDTSNVIDMSVMFSGCVSLSTLDISEFDTSNVRNMGCMFSGCNKLINLDFSHWDISNVECYEYFMDEGKEINGQPWQTLFE